MKIIYFIVFIIPALLFAQSRDAEYYNIYNALNIFGSAFEKLNMGYVSDVNPNELIKQSIKGMVSDLDPYTRLEEKDIDGQSDYLSTGSYIGFGFSVDLINKKNTIVSITNGYSADKAGLRVGDELISVDSTNVIGISPDSLRQLLLGKLGTSSIFKYFRFGTNDTSKVSVTRTKVAVRDVPFYKLIDSITGYIKLDQFSVKADFEFRRSLRELDSNNQLKFLIIDLRNNPGGVMQAALRILELFMPENTLLLTTRGKLASNSQKYYSQIPPEYPNLKVAVLINDGSASASEIVAGAFQDTDRGLVIGQKSFGKGLVQQTFDLDENSKLRMTIAKYYTPSGRCIQKIDYDGIDKNQYDLKTDDLFKTKNGRTVNKEDGISPDIVIKEKKRPEIVNNLIKSDFIFNFAVYHSSKFDKSSDDFLFKVADFDKFLKYMDKEKRYYELDELKIFEDLSKKKYKDILSSNSQDNITVLENSIKGDLRKSLIDNKKQIVELINRSVTYILKGREFTFFNEIDKDDYVNQAIKSLNNDYNEILKISSTSNSNAKN